jgi:tripartite ATP-independent transporter DctP family solute receptor
VSATIAAPLVLSRTALAADHTIKYALIAQAGQPVERGAQRFKQLVEQGSGGKIAVQIFPGGSLGGEIEQQDSVANGTIQMCNLGVAVTAGKLPKLNILNMYYLWKDRDHMNKVMTGPIGQELFKEYEQRTGNKVLPANWQQGTRQMLSKKKALTPGEMRGIKIRVTAGAPIFNDLWTAMGANPVPLPFPETYSAMQTGVVDAVELPADWIFNNGFHKLGKHLLETSHSFYTNLPLINAKFFAAMPGNLQALVEDASRQAGVYQSEIVLKEQAELLGKIKDSGVEILKLDIEPFRQAVRPVYEKNMNSWGRETYEKINAA